MGEKILMLVLGGLLLICAIQDLIKKRIYLWSVAIGAALTLACLPVIAERGIVDCIGGLAVGLAALLISRATGGKIGLGDGIILCVTGLGLGFWSNLELFGIALFLAAVLSIILLALRLVNRKQSIPFIPFLLAGYLIIVFASRGELG